MRFRIPLFEIMDFASLSSKSWISRPSPRNHGFRVVKRGRFRKTSFSESYPFTL